MKLLALLLSFLLFVPPVFAMYVGEARPVYKREITYIFDKECKAVAIVPYSGMSYYRCPSGEDFWSEVLVGSEGSPLFMMFKNRKQVSDDDTNESVAINTVMY